MDRTDIIVGISNFLIMLPAIVTFIYLEPTESPYWASWYPVFFIIPFVKYFSPRDFRKNVYPLTIIAFVLYVMASDVRTIFKKKFFLSSLFVLAVNQNDVSTVLLTVTTAIVFVFIVEGILSKKTERTVYYMFLSITSTVYFLSALNISKLANLPFMEAFDYTSILLYYNVYLLIFKGYEFLTLLISPSFFVVNILIITSVFSIIGLIFNLSVIEKNNRTKRLDAIAYPIMIGGIAAFILSYLLEYLPYSIYSIFFTTIIVIVFMFLIRLSDRKDNYPLNLMGSEINGENDN